MKQKQSAEYARGYQAGYAAAMKRRLVHGKPLGKPQQEEPVYCCAKCGAESPSSVGDCCPRCGSAEIAGQVNDRAALPPSSPVADVNIIDPRSEAGQRMIRNSAFERPTTQGDQPPPPATDDRKDP